MRWRQEIDDVAICEHYLATKVDAEALRQRGLDGVDKAQGDDDPWRAGFGVNGGYTLRNALYLGGNFEYFALFVQSGGGGFSKDSVLRA